MKFKKICFLSISALLLFSVIVLSYKTLAQESDTIGLALSPPTFEISANPGDVLTNSIRVQNLNDFPIEVSVDQRNFTAVGEEGSVGLTEEETGFSLASWITVIPEKGRIPAHATQNFIFKTEIPLNAEPGGHFGSIIFRMGGETPKETGAAVAQELGALVLLRIAGKAKEEACIETFSAKKAVYDRGPVEFEIRVKNEGNVHVKPTGSITVSNLFGKEVADFEIDPRNVLPGAIRKIPASWDKGLLFGKYKATASLTYGNKGKVLIASTTFFGFPYKIGGIILAVLIVLIIIVFKVRKRLKLALQVLFGKYK